MTIVKLAKRRSSTGATTASLGVPKPIAEALAKVEIESFAVELTDDGILYKPVVSTADTNGKDVPEWLRPRS